MVKIVPLSICLCAVFTLVAELQADPQKFWPQWRGPHATGVASTGNPPVEWSEGKNVRWKIEIPGKGSASPIVWGEPKFTEIVVTSFTASLS